VRHRRRASRAALIPESHNYPGFAGIAGPELLARLRDQATRYGATVEAGRVTGLSRAHDGIFTAWCGDRTIQAHAVLMATGLVDVSPGIEGLRAVYTGAVRYCPICDGFEATDRRIGVIGSIEAGSKKARFLRTYSRDVLLFETGARSVGGGVRDELHQDGVTLPGRASSVEYIDDKVAVVVEDGSRVMVDVLYPALGCAVRSELGAACTPNQNLKVDDHQQTSVDLLYAAGDVVSDLHQLSVPTGHAAIAASDIHNRLARNPR
jgi:thioredoxin reductase (NADPH)